MKKRRTILVVALIATVAIVAITSTLLHAQEKPVPPERKPGASADTTARKPEAQLPKIDLPEFVITGNESIALPEFRKTALEENLTLDGFKMRGPGQRESTRVALRNAGKDQMGFDNARDGFNGRLMAGYGSYRTPFLDGWFGKAFSGSDFLFKAGYKSSDGFVENTAFRSGYAAISGGTYISEESSMFAGSRVRAGLGFQGNSYRLYGTASPATKRTVNRSTLSLSANSSYADPFTYTTGLYVQTASIKDVTKTNETALGGEFSATKSFDGFALRGDIGLWTDFYDAPSALQNPYFTQFSLSMRTHFSDQVDLVVGGSAYIASGSRTGRAGKIYPKIQVSWFMMESVTLFANYTPHVQRGSLSNVVEESPYVVNDVGIRNAEYYHDAALGAQLNLPSSVTARLSFNYKQVRNNVIYIDPLATGMWIPSYFGTTRLLSVEGEFYVDITDADHLGASAVVRNSRNSVTGEQIPYLSLAQLSGLYQHKFPFGLTVGSTLQVFGRQYTDPLAQAPLPAFTLLDFKVEYEIMRQLSVAFMLNNVLDENQIRWKGYRGIPRTAALGLNLSW